MSRLEALRGPGLRGRGPDMRGPSGGPERSRGSDPEGFSCNAVQHEKL